jgi:hypothetical protein
MTNPLAAPSSFTVGQWVSVASRTSPGINQPGGIGRITALDEDRCQVSVKYVLDGRHEKNVHLQYVQMYTWEERTAASSSSAPKNSRLRDRNMLLGRCTYCGSLRADCQSCDWRRRETTTFTPSSSLKTNPGGDTDSRTSNSSDDDSAYERMMQTHRRQYLRYKRSLRRAALWSHHHHFNEHSNKSPPLPTRRRLSNWQNNGISILAAVGAANDNSSTESDHSRGTVDHPMVDLSSNSSDNDHALDHLPLDQLAARARQPFKSMTQHPSFIQPEGDADRLPNDIPDLTASCTYPQLLPLLDEILQRMETVDIPQAKQDLLQFQRAFHEAQQDPVLLRSRAQTLQQQR